MSLILHRYRRFGVPAAGDWPEHLRVRYTKTQPRELGFSTLLPLHIMATLSHNCQISGSDEQPVHVAVGVSIRVTGNLAALSPHGDGLATDLDTRLGEGLGDVGGGASLGVIPA